MKSLHKNRAAEVPAGSMADIAFLMLTFYMVTTVIRVDEGITLLLPPIQISEPQPIHDRNLFTILINSHDQFLVENERRTTVNGLRDEIKLFIMNHGKNPSKSVSPEKAIVSLKTDRGASYRIFVQMLDEIQAAYYELYASQAGITAAQFRSLDLTKQKERELYYKGKNGIPMNLSIADSQ
jgi:biopolymer transport protein ExbD